MQGKLFSSECTTAALLSGDWTNPRAILENFSNILKLMHFIKRVKHRVDMLMNELYNEPIFGQIEKCLERTWNAIQGHSSMSIPCGQSDSRTLAFGFSKELGNKITLTNY